MLLRHITLIFVSLISVFSMAEEPENASRLTGQWGGLRTRMEDHGIDLGLTYKSEVSRVLSGGIRRATVGLGNLDLKLDLDGEKLAASREQPQASTSWRTTARTPRHLSAMSRARATSKPP